MTKMGTSSQSCTSSACKSARGPTGSRPLGWGGVGGKRSRRRVVHRQVEFFDNGWRACLHPGDTRSQRHPGNPRKGHASAAAGEMTNGSTSACLQCFLSGSLFSAVVSWRTRVGGSRRVQGRNHFLPRQKSATFSWTSVFTPESNCSDRSSRYTPRLH